MALGILAGEEQFCTILPAKLVTINTPLHKHLLIFTFGFILVYAVTHKEFGGGSDPLIPSFECATACM